LAVHPVAFQLGSLTIHWYGVMVALGFLIGLWNASRRALKAGFAHEKVLDLGPWLILGGILGGRLLYVISYWEKDFAGKPLWEIFAVHHGGLVFYGGLIGATLAGILYALARKVPVWRMADLLTPSLALGYAIGRVGCFLNGCCYGRPTDVPWAMRFPTGHETEGQPVHPTQVYESLFSLGLYLALAWFYRRRRFDGQVFAVYLISCAALRSFVEIFRGDYTQYYFGGIVTPAHFVSAGIAAVGLLLIWLLPRRQTAGG
jgi:phosphatidylglycerol---prolipoprotein diacylglyceryl transferase